MSDQQGEDPTPAILAETARECVEKLLRGGGACRGSVALPSGGLTVRVAVSPTPARRHPRPTPAPGPNVLLTDCERDCCELIGALTTEQQRAGAEAIRDPLGDCPRNASRLFYEEGEQAKEGQREQGEPVECSARQVRHGGTP